MAIEGYFELGDRVTPAPHVLAYIYFPRLGIVDEISFLIDTGADSTSLHPRDINNLGIDYSYLREDSLISSRGIGGSIEYYRERGVLRFKESAGEDRFCQLDIHICERTDEPAMQGLPSLLGRDFLNLCSVHLDNALNLVHLEPRTVSGGFIQ